MSGSVRTELLVFMAAHVIEQDAPVVNGARVFEFGCGTGRNLAAMKRHGALHLAWMRPV